MTLKTGHINAFGRADVHGPPTDTLATTWLARELDHTHNKPVELNKLYLYPFSPFFSIIYSTMHIVYIICERYRGSLRQSLHKPSTLLYSKGVCFRAFDIPSGWRTLWKRVLSVSLHLLMISPPYDPEEHSPTMVSLSPLEVCWIRAPPKMQTVEQIKGRHVSACLALLGWG